MLRPRQYGLLIFLLTTSFSINAAVNLGQASQNILVPVSGLAHIFYMICRVVGVGLVAGAMAQFFERRRNPRSIPFSRPVFMLIVGVIIFCLPLLAQSSEAARAIYD